MKKKGNVYKGMLIGILVVVVFMITICFVLLKNADKITDDGFLDVSKLDTSSNNTKTYDDPDIKFSTNKSYKDAEEVLKDFNTYYSIEKRDSSQTLQLYVKFPKDLYNEDGSSNQEYFEELIKRTASYVEDRRFILYDSKHEISILVTRDDANSEIKYKINNLSNYFEEFDYYKYKEALESQIVQEENIRMLNNSLQSIFNNNMVLNKSLGDAEYAYGRYTYYQDGTLKLTTRNGTVLNMVFLDEYKDDIVKGINTKTTIEEVYKLYPNFAFGGPSQGYLGYRTPNFYIYVYNDEVSIDNYSYSIDGKIAEYIDEYYKTRNLSDFAYNISSYWKSFDEYEYNTETNYLKITYPNYGLFIEIFANADAKITVYSNFMIDERMAKLIGEGRVTLVKDADSLNEWEQKRRLNEASEQSEEYRELNKNKINKDETIENINQNTIETVKIY